MKAGIFRSVADFFKTWFLPQASHDEQFPLTREEGAVSSHSPEQNPQKNDLESAEEMERRTSRESAPENMNMHEQDLSGLAKPPEGADERASRSGNPFSRSRAE